MSSQLQHKLQQFETVPPKDVWSAIEERLDDSTLTLQERLFDYQAAPPASAWNEITNLLDNSSIQKAVVQPIFKKTWFRVAVAAVFLGVIAMSILTYSVKQPSTAIAKQPLAKQDRATSSTYKKPASVNTTTTQKQTTKAIIPIKEESISVPASTSSKEHPATITKHYKVVAKEDGQMVRLSQKAYAVFDCAVKSAAQTSTTCKENIQTMQAKMASSLITPSTDFAGLIDMIKTLEENK